MPFGQSLQNNVITLKGCCFAGRKKEMFWSVWGVFTVSPEADRMNI